ncbi:MAG: hypothetical protein A3F09_01450 [Chlamydiae bacterium RIFCSPHIGHO2_12_FULL_49_11]|nr:MAG: hypothetical protein A3F09_01450 [Chlamydiae bacterium RIFCSPHIGHO2_12_FULL_49_11]
MYPRHLTKYILKYAKEYPILALVGPRQSGKTTLVKSLFPSYKYVSLENITTRKVASEDPRGFLQTYGSFLILDEVQNVPEIFSALQQLVDEDQTPAQYILTGSSQFLLIENITQSLAGRIVTFKLFPFSFSEICRYEQEKSGDEIFRVMHPDRIPVSQEELFQFLLKGSYPRIYDKNIEGQKWYENYILTYVERDIRILLNVRNLRVFEHFLLLCASRSGQLVDYNDLSNALGIAVSTVKEWISILETSGIIFILSPFFNNFSKRVTKTPKLYFIDTGILCHLLSIQTVDHLKTHPLLGWIFETFIISECYKRFCNLGVSPPLYFYRDSAQNEIDLLIYNGICGFPVEIKLSQSFHFDYRKSIEQWMNLPNNPADKGLIVYCGEDIVQKGEPIPAVPWYLF